MSQHFHCWELGCCFCSVNWDHTGSAAQPGEKKTLTQPKNKKLPTNKIPGPDGFTGIFYQTFRDEVTATLLNPFQKNCRGRDTPKLILCGYHHPDTKTRQRYDKENYRQYHQWTQAQKSATIYQRTASNHTLKGSYTVIKRDLSRNARIFLYLQIDWCDIHINKLNKNCMIISIDAEKAFDKIQQPFMIKKRTLESCHRENIPQYNKKHI